MRRFLIPAILIIGGLAPNFAFAEDVLQIGIVASISGPFAVSGQEFVSGAENAAKMINAGGGIGGRKIELSVNDGACNPAIYASAAEQLVHQLNSKAVIELGCGGSIAATNNVFENLQVPHLTFGGTELVNQMNGIGKGDITNGDTIEISKVLELFEKDSIIFTEASASGFLAIEILKSAAIAAGSNDRSAIASSLRENSFSTSGGVVKFMPVHNGGTDKYHTFAVELWSKKKDCPKCPKAGTCPQALELLIESKKTCN